MKGLVVSLAVLSSCVTGQAQGTVAFSNIGPAGLGPNAPVYESDGATKVSGSQYMAELLGGASASTLAPIATTSFLTGNGAGYFNDGIQAIPTVPSGGIVWVAVEVWNTASGASFDQAKASGLPNSWWESSVFSEQTTQFNGVPEPALLTGLGNSPVYLNGAVPEPSTLALTGLGAVVLLLHFHRRRNI